MTLPADLIIRPFIVRVSGFGELTWFARSRGKALATAWEAYCSYRDDVDFKEFLKMARCIGQVAHGSRFGEAITVCSERAYYVSHDRQYIQFVRPNSEVIQHAHPLDIEPPEARRGTPYAEPANPDNPVSQIGREE